MPTPTLSQSSWDFFSKSSIANARALDIFSKLVAIIHFSHPYEISFPCTICHRSHDCADVLDKSMVENCQTMKPRTSLVGVCRSWIALTFSSLTLNTICHIIIMIILGLSHQFASNVTQKNQLIADGATFLLLQLELLQTVQYASEYLGYTLNLRFPSWSILAHHRNTQPPSLFFFLPICHWHHGFYTNLNGPNLLDWNKIKRGSVTPFNLSATDQGVMMLGSTLNHIYGAIPSGSFDPSLLLWLAGPQVGPTGWSRTVSCTIRTAL